MTRLDGIFRRRGTALSAIALIFLGAAILRLPGEGPAVAEVAGQLAAGKRKTADEKAVSRAPDVGVNARSSCLAAGNEAALLAAIRDRQKQLDQQAARLGRRMQLVMQAEQKMAAERKALLEAERKLAATLARADKAAEKDLARLTAVYENMKPRVAAELFAKMAPEFAAGFMGRMRPEAAAAIMSAIPPGRAYALSVILAGRNADVPRD